ncbi:hypothetical protein J2Z69_000995 [Paenibacillus shirakamiensis]|uniref:Lipoprotein n=1 Tax=Paenibacillus shirakamiensis TaxID=1265935 RepID=A0ABS4JG76_9BACL|nr:hypothetical protein [Paenibacillus shirakamiensis]MBP1999976.1 hypothetical protein [Paenibacillus shirakamiensis]
MLFLTLIISFSIMVACSNQPSSNHGKISNEQLQKKVESSNNSSNSNLSEGHASVFPKTGIEESILIDAVHDTPSIRAETQTEHGTLFMISKGREEEGHLLVSSTTGLEGSKTFQSTYSILFKQGEQEKVLLELPAYLYVQPTDKILTFKKIAFKEADLYFLTPQYQSGHGLEAFVFAIEKQTGKAFSILIKNNNQDIDRLIYSEAKDIAPLYIKNNQLVVVRPLGAGGPPDKDGHYKLDMVNKKLVAE